MEKLTKYLIPLLIVVIPKLSFAEMKHEDYYNDIFCNQINGQREVRHDYDYGNGSSYVLIDCETSEYVVEGGKDKRSSLDNLQQAVFFSVITGKKPLIVIYDTDNNFGRFEYRIEQSARKMGVKFLNPSL